MVRSILVTATIRSSACMCLPAVGQGTGRDRAAASPPHPLPVCSQKRRSRCVFRRFQRVWGLTIDLSALNRTELSPDKTYVIVGAGNRWVDVCNAIAPEGLIVVGGRAADIGVGGLTLGGKDGTGSISIEDNEMLTMFPL